MVIYERSMTQNPGSGESAEAGHAGGDDDETEDDESHIVIFTRACLLNRT